MLVSLKRKNNIVISSPVYFNRYPPEYQEMVNSWLTANL